jgi:hypothetical protein
VRSPILATFFNGLKHRLIGAQSLFRRSVRTEAVPFVRGSLSFQETREVMNRITLITGASAAAFVGAQAIAQTTLVTGPSSSATPYVVGVPGSPVRQVVSMLTVGDTIGGYQFLGIPDGMGAFMSNGTMKLFIDHEFTASAAVGQRAHQPAGVSGGAFLSAWTIDPSTFQVLSGYDAMTSCATVTNGTGGSLYKFARFCSGDVPEVSALYNAASGNGTQNRFFICGEESGTPGRMIATDLDTGVAYQMTAFDASVGSWENGLARPMASDTTVVIGTSDGGANRMFVYVGTKQSTGTPAERAGLMNGTAYGIQVQVGGVNVTAEDRVNALGNATSGPVYSGTFTLAPGGTAAGTQFLRPEDGAWDPANPRDFYVVNTDRMSTTSAGAPQTHGSRLYRLRFNDVNNVLAGGTIEAVLDGTDVMEMGDNLCVYNTIQGGTRVILQEDPGNHPHSAKTLVYDAQSDSVQVILKSDSARFGDVGLPATAPFSQDEENSGVFDARDTLGLGWFVGNMQAHYSVAAPLIEGGQLYAFFSPALVGSCDADVGTMDGNVDGADLGALLANWGLGGRTDLTGDGNTDGADLGALLNAWGACAQ